MHSFLHMTSFLPRQSYQLFMWRHNLCLLKSKELDIMIHPFDLQPLKFEWPKLNYFNLQFYISYMLINTFKYFCYFGKTLKKKYWNIYNFFFKIISIDLNVLFFMYKIHSYIFLKFFNCIPSKVLNMFWFNIFRRVWSWSLYFKID